nr:MAG TPA: hypothetical protein [Caudoviricetes sp.]
MSSLVHASIMANTAFLQSHCNYIVPPLLKSFYV